MAVSAARLFFVNFADNAGTAKYRAFQAFVMWHFTRQNVDVVCIMRSAVRRTLVMRKIDFQRSVIRFAKIDFLTL